MNDELKEILKLIDTGRTHEARNRLAQIISTPQRYDIDAQKPAAVKRLWWRLLHARAKRT